MAFVAVELSKSVDESDGSGRLRPSPKQSSKEFMFMKAVANERSLGVEQTEDEEEPTNKHSR